MDAVCSPDAWRLSALTTVCFRRLDRYVLVWLPVPESDVTARLGWIQMAVGETERSELDRD